MKDGKRLVITIGRQFGSGGCEVGTKLAQELGLDFYDKNILRMNSDESGIKESYYYMADEKAGNKHPGNIRKQTERMWENVEALLKEADCTFDDLGQMIVYLRDIADYAVVKEMYDKRFPATPKVFVHAPVCRPGWLIEMECMGVKALENKEYAPF